jgi:hypothetical protein
VHHCAHAHFFGVFHLGRFVTDVELVNRLAGVVDDEPDGLADGNREGRWLEAQAVSEHSYLSSRVDHGSRLIIPEEP